MSRRGLSRGDAWKAANEEHLRGLLFLDQRRRKSMSKKKSDLSLWGRFFC